MMKKIYSLIIFTTLLSTSSTAQNCIDIKKSIDSSHWKGTNVETIKQGDNYNGKPTLYLQDGSGSSVSFNNVDFKGNWLLRNCLCFDYKVDWLTGRGINTIPTKVPKLGIYTGSPITSGTDLGNRIRAGFVGLPTLPDIIDNEWKNFCLPVGLSVNNQLPSNDFGQWTIASGSTVLTGAAAAVAWDNLIQNVTGFYLWVDYNNDPSEIVNFSNFCWGCPEPPKPPCTCPPTQAFKLEIYDGKPKAGGKIITTLENGSPFQGQCFKNYFFYPKFNCPDNCSSISEVKIVTPTKDTISDNSYQFNIKGSWQVIVYPKCGDKVCEIIKYNINIPNCDCPPPDCCKEKLEFGDNGLMKVIAKADGTTLNISGTLFGSSAEGYKEVRISVLDVLIQSENKNVACISCLTNPKQWASIGKSYINKFTEANQTEGVNNPREVRFVATNAVKLDGVNYGFNILLPPPSTLECCKLNATITIKITLRDNQCRECDYVFTTTIPLETKTYGAQDNTTSPSGSGPSSNRKSSDIFSGCTDCLPIKNFQGSRIIKD